MYDVTALMNLSPVAYVAAVYPEIVGEVPLPEGVTCAVVLCMCGDDDCFFCDGRLDTLHREDDEERAFERSGAGW